MPVDRARVLKNDIAGTPRTDLRIEGLQPNYQNPPPSSLTTVNGPNHRAVFAGPYTLLSLELPDPLLLADLAATHMPSSPFIQRMAEAPQTAVLKGYIFSQTEGKLNKVMRQILLAMDTGDKALYKDNLVQLAAVARDLYESLD